MPAERVPDEDVLRKSGEAVGKEVQRALQRRRALAVSLKAHVHAIEVQAYLARRALDYLLGFHLSQILWRKLPGAT